MVLIPIKHFILFSSPHILTSTCSLRGLVVTFCYKQRHRKLKSFLESD